MQQIHKYRKADFDNNGYHHSGKLFSDIIHDWELEFNNEFKPYFANHIIANNSSMLLLKSCFVTTETEDFGMDGETDFDTNLEIEKFSKRQTIYAIGSELKENKDEPLFLVTDDKASDGVVILKYIPDNDDENELPAEPINTGIKIKVLVPIQS